jgi:uncharacterized protein YecT (DUF1311 family)
LAAIFSIWDSMLNQEYQRLLGALEGKMATSVRVAQRAWIAARDADCHVTDEITADGAASRINAASCMLGKTGERVIQLRSWWDMAHPEDMAHAEGDTAEDSLPVLTSPH